MIYKQLILLSTTAITMPVVMNAVLKAEKIEQKNTNNYLHSVNDGIKKSADDLQSFLRNAALKLLKEVNKDQPFALTGISLDHTFGDALNALKAQFAHDQEFKGIEWVSITEAHKKLNDSDLKNGHQFQWIKFKLGNKETKKIRVHYKGIIENPQQHLRNAALKLLKKINKNQPFALTGINLHDTFNETFNVLKSSFANDDNFKGLQWISITDLNKRLDDKDFINGNQFQLIKFKLGQHQTAMFRVFYTGIEAGTSVYLDTVTKKLQKFDKSNLFKLSNYQTKITFQTAFEQLKTYFKNDNDFKNVEWILKNNLSTNLSRDSKGQITIPLSLQLKLINKVSQTINVFLTTNSNYNDKLQRSVVKFKDFLVKNGNSFMLSENLSEKNTYEDAFEELKLVVNENFKNDKDFEDVKLLATNQKALNNKINFTARNSYRVSYVQEVLLNWKGQTTAPIKIYYRMNIIYIHNQIKKVYERLNGYSKQLYKVNLNNDYDFMAYSYLTPRINSMVFEDSWWISLIDPLLGRPSNNFPFIDYYIEYNDGSIKIRSNEKVRVYFENFKDY